MSINETILVLNAGAPFDKFEQLLEDEEIDELAERTDERIRDEEEDDNMVGAGGIENR
jgi:hypothetical protein